MTEPLVLDPPSAVAAARCLIARLWRLPSLANVQVDAMHPRPCAWEDWDRHELAEMLTAFNRDAYDNRGPHPDVDRFRRLSAPEQRALVRAAQYPMEEAA